MRIDRAKELTYTGRQFSGEEAVALGLVTGTAEDPLAAAQELAAEIASKSPSAIQHGKRLYDTTWTMQDLNSALLLETQLQRELIGKPNQQDSTAADSTERPGMRGGRPGEDS
jgi:enoyl-CoA hydratase/carnithine racemase